MLLAYFLEPPPIYGYHTIPYQYHYLLLFSSWLVNIIVHFWFSSTCFPNFNNKKSLKTHKRIIINVSNIFLLKCTCEHYTKISAKFGVSKLARVLFLLLIARVLSTWIHNVYIIIIVIDFKTTKELTKWLLNFQVINKLRLKIKIIKNKSLYHKRLLSEIIYFFGQILNYQKYLLKIKWLR
jgi:hypothetical protein